MSAEIEPMMSRFPDLARASGYTIASSADGSWCLYNVGGEIKLYLRWQEGRYALSVSERGREERMIFASDLLVDVEKFLAVRLTNLYRRRQGLPFLMVTSIPVTAESLAAGFSLLRDQDGTLVLAEEATGTQRRGRLIPLVEFSHYSSLRADDVWRFTRQPEGSRVFTATA